MAKPIYNNAGSLTELGSTDTAEFSGMSFNGSAIEFTSEITTPATPSAGGKIYVKSDNLPYFLDDTGTEYGLTGTGTGLADLTVENGFPNQTDSTLSFVDLTRTFSISPAVASFDFWAGGVKYTKSATENVVISDLEGIHAIYYVNGTLTAEYEPTPTDFDGLILKEYAFIAAIYWDATNNEAIRVEDERHGRIMDSETHTYLHNTRGTQFQSGLALGNILADENGDVDTHAQFSVATGIIWDEDIKFDISSLGATTARPMLYRSGASGGWRQTSTTYTVLASGTPRAYFNEDTGSTWQQTEVSSGDFVLTHVFVSGDVNDEIFLVQGQAEYNTLNLARTGAETEAAALAFGQLSALITEYVLIATIINQTSNAYDNAVGTRIRSTDDGSDYIDWRGTSPAGGAGGTAVSDHNSLVGLQGGTTGEYYHLTSAQHTNAIAPFSNQENLLMNGRMEISQRGTSFALALEKQYTLDRWQWRKNIGPARVTVSQSTVVPSTADAGMVINNSLKIAVTTADPSFEVYDYYGIMTHVEGYIIAPYATQDVTISFWVRYAQTGTYSISVRNSSRTHSFVHDFTINTADTWEKKEFTLTLDDTQGTWAYDETSGLTLWFCFGVGTTFSTSTVDSWVTGNYVASTNQINAVDAVNDEFYITDVRMVPGDEADNMVVRPYGVELARCQRYYFSTSQTIFGTPAALTTPGTLIRTTVEYKTTMRTTPTIALGTASGINSVSATSGSIDGFTLAGTANSAGTPASIAGYSADADI